LTLAGSMQIYGDDDDDVDSVTHKGWREKDTTSSSRIWSGVGSGDRQGPRRGSLSRATENEVFLYPVFIQYANVVYKIKHVYFMP